LRLLRLGTISSLASITSKSNPGAKPILSINAAYILVLVYMMMFAINSAACVMLFIAYIESPEDSWMASLGWTNLPNATQPQQWCSAAYWVITMASTTGYGDITPRSIAEQVVANLYMIFGVVFAGFLIGTIAFRMARTSKQVHKLLVFRKKIGRVSEWLHDNHVPEQTRKRVKAYFTQVWAIREDMALDADIFNDLSHHLRHQVAAYIMTRPVASLSLFKTQELGLQRLLARYMRPVDITPGSDLCQQGEEGDRLWILTEGRVDALQHLSPPLHLSSPCLIGDSVVVADDIPSFRFRAYTVRTFDHHGCKVWELQVSSLWPLLRKYPNLRMDAMEHIRNRTLIGLASGLVGGPASRGAARGSVGVGEVMEELSGSDGVHSHKPPSPSEERLEGADWCEAAASISRALLQQQSPELVDLTCEELRAARIDDGSVQQLLDTLLEFSTTKAHRGIPTNEPPGEDPPSVPSPRTSGAPLTSLASQSYMSATGTAVGRRHTLAPLSKLGSTSMPVSRRGPALSFAAGSQQPCGGLAGAGSGPGVPPVGDDARGCGSDSRAGRHNRSHSQDVLTLDNAAVALAASGATDGAGANGDKGKSGQKLSMPAPCNLFQASLDSSHPFNASTELSAAATAAGGTLPCARAPASTNVCVCPTCNRPVCSKCGTKVLQQSSATQLAGSSTAQPSVSEGLKGVRGALGLGAPKPQWRPNRLGRQTLFRMSALVDRQGSLNATSIPVQEFGVGYTNFG